jgi:hypothetical protein
MTHSRCEDEIVSKLKSPDGRYMAILYHRKCARSPNQFTGVTVEEVGMFASLFEKQPMLSLDGIHEISGTWISPTHLEVTSPAFSDPKTVLNQETTWKTMTISYKQ